MKMFLKGGSCIEVSDDDYFCTISKEKIGFILQDSKRESRLWSKGVYTFEDLVIPREFVERIEL